jgi:pyruvate decarboxylase
MTRTISLAKYLFTRLSQQGVCEVYGVPGDYTLKAIDHLKQSGLQWIPNSNELNAGYAADSSARIAGPSSLLMV